MLIDGSRSTTYNSDQILAPVDGVKHWQSGTGQLARYQESILGSTLLAVRDNHGKTDSSLHIVRDGSRQGVFGRNLTAKTKISHKDGIVIHIF